MKICSRSVGPVIVASVNRWKKGSAFGRADCERHSSKWAESMSDLEELVASFHREFEESLGQESYLLADGRGGRISLYEHLVLTSGIAAAFAEELLRRGKSPEEICGLSLSSPELRQLACLCGLLHDLGKARVARSEYRLHVQRGAEYAAEWLTAKGVEGQLREVIVRSVAHHHLHDNPGTLLEKLVALANIYASAGDRSEVSHAGTHQPLEEHVAPTEQLEGELFGVQPPLCLLMGDTDAIKSYVYESHALPDIRGASQILVEREEDVFALFGERLVKECLIYCGGGGFLALVPASMVEELQQELEKCYLQKTQVATVTVVASEPLGYAHFARGLAPHSEDVLRSLSGEGLAADLLFSHFEALLTDRNKRKNFGELVSAVTGKLQQAKRMRERTPFIEALPVSRRCNSCGKRAAESWDSVKQEWLCCVCQNKRDTGREERRQFLGEFEEWSAKNRGCQTKFRRSEDLETLAGTGGKIALLYADGNNMGDLLQLMPSPASYRHFSQVLESATKEALFEAIWTVFGEELSTRASQSVPFEIIALGGDDVVVMVRAEQGWALALQVLKRFESHPGIRKLESEIREQFGEGILRRRISLTLSAGLAIADMKYPVSFLFTLAEGLLKRAKYLARQRGKGTLCHLWLRAPVISEKAEAVLDALYERQSEQGTVLLTARPYTHEDAEKLTILAQKLAVLPATQRRTLAEALEKGVHVSLNYSLYQAARQKEQQQRRALRETFQELGELLEAPSSGFWFWHKVPHAGWKTALLDALELIELGAEKHYPTGEHHGAPAAD